MLSAVLVCIVRMGSDYVGGLLNAPVRTGHLDDDRVAGLAAEGHAEGRPVLARFGGREMFTTLSYLTFEKVNSAEREPDLKETWEFWQSWGRELVKNPGNAQGTGTVRCVNKKTKRSISTDFHQ
jgi:hypothetical protein